MSNTRDASVDRATQEAHEHFLRSVEQMHSNAVLMRAGEGYAVYPVFVSNEFARMMECTVEEAKRLIAGIGFIKTTKPEDRPLVRSMFRNHVAYDGSNELTIRKVTAKKNEVWCNVEFAFIDDFGEHYIFCTYSVVTKLKDYEARLRSVYSSQGDRFYQMDDKTLSVLRVNLAKDSIEEVRGVDPYDTDSIAVSYSECIHQRARLCPIPADRTRFLETFNRDRLLRNYRSARTEVSQTLYSTRKDGRSCFVNISASLVTHPLTGNVIAFIIERECNAEKVGETLTGKILAQQFDMVAYLADGRYGVTIGEAANIKHGSIFPTKNEGIYQHYLDNQVIPVLVGTEEQKANMARALQLDVITEQLKLHEPYVVDIAIEIDGTTYYKHFDFYNVDPEAQFYVLLKSDTTEIQREQIAANERLNEALEAANQANVAKTAFLSSMSHEIRTPMNAIIGLNTIALKNPDLPAETREHLEKIEGSAKHLLGLINDILDMSRIESGRLAIRSEEFSFKDMLDQINTMIGGQCQDKGLAYECRMLNRVDDYYIGDDMKLKQVIINILGNAVKFTPTPGTVSFTVERTAEFDGRSTLRFTMSDTGIGMDADYLPKIFEAFSQENDRSATKYGSTGLGMAITKNIVELMNGSISVESEKGGGTTFTVDVTLRNSEISHADDIVNPGDIRVPAIDDDPIDLSGRHLLLAEDIELNAEIVMDLLDMEDISVDHAENGQIAVEMFKASAPGTYDAILMDVQMPVLDGLEASKLIRALDHPDATSVPIIAMTANAFDEDVQRSLQAGMNAHLSKPIDIDLLMETLGELLAN